ncbi:hypothetical protein Q7469_12250, partial [Glaesserella parasuis]|nr:hypothetical protein [Glaesserella parasuis]MDO9914475.1 hypothetical protein [Glaesserella parasuis]
MSRVNYKTLKQWFFEDAYQWCQEKFENGKINSWDVNFNEWGVADSYRNQTKEKNHSASVGVFVGF